MGMVLSSGTNRLQYQYKKQVERGVECFNNVQLRTKTKAVTDSQLFVLFVNFKVDLSIEEENKIVLHKLNFTLPDEIS